jgi:protein-S-isoprenylcysteine O-methyltransferase Ste14
MIAKHILLTLAAAAAAIYVACMQPPQPWTPLRIFGLCLTAVAFVLWTLARFTLGSSFAVSAQAKQLVTRGLYAKLRNPIYIFGSLFIAGYVLLLGRPKGLLIFVVIIPLQIWRAHKEARILEAKFGETYKAYRAKTWL